jgi:hypothetical protein
MDTSYGDAFLDALLLNPTNSGYALSPETSFYLANETVAEAHPYGPFSLGQNYPNPFEGETTVPFTLNTPADVRLDLLDLGGRKVAGVVRKGRGVGEQSIKLNLRGLGLPPGDYFYQLQISCKHGLFSQRLLMTAE